MHIGENSGVQMYTSHQSNMEHLYETLNMATMLPFLALAVLAKPVALKIALSVFFSDIGCPTCNKTQHGLYI
jgi:hypothetical protein